MIFSVVESGTELRLTRKRLLPCERFGLSERAIQVGKGVRCPASGLASVFRPERLLEIDLSLLLATEHPSNGGLQFLWHLPLDAPDTGGVLDQIRHRVHQNGEKQKHRTVTSDDALRARRSSANRIWTLLRAALNHAFQNGNAASDIAWRKVKPFKNVDTARLRYLTIAEAQRLINASEPDFRQLVQAALQTGARYSELARLTVTDFNPDVGTVQIRQSKSGKPRHIVLTDEGSAFFKQLTAGRTGDAPMLPKADGSTWKTSHQLRPMADAVRRAKIKPAVSFHGIRHTWASHAVMNGMPLMVVARNLGHVDTRMVEKHYGHLAPSYVADAIRTSAPRFGSAATNVLSMGRR